MSVIVLGGINEDVVAHVDHLPRPGETVASLGVTRSSGGKGLNKAVAAAKFGGRVTMLGAVGDDEAGRMLRATLADAGVNDAGVETVADAPTGQAIITLTPGGENCIVVNAGANARLSSADIDVPTGTGAVVLAEFEAPVAMVRQLFESAAAQAGTRILNTAPALGDEAARAVVAMADILILNETELEAYAASRTPLTNQDAILAAARGLIGETAQRVIVTLGAAGCLLVDRERHEAIASHRVEAIDTIGAGDCFCGVFAAALADGMAIAPAIRHANAAAAISVGRRGAAAASPTRDEVLGFLHDSVAA